MVTEDLAEFEAAYQDRLKPGQTRWHPGSYDDFEMRPFLDSMIPLLQYPLERTHVLDLGCGTGQVSAYFAALGGVVTGVDASPTAIEFARRKLAERTLSATFQVGDLRTFAFLPHSFDLAVDCNFLHCIVFSPDRESVLHRIAGWLRPGGEIWSETMIGIPKVTMGDDYIIDEAGVLWKILGDMRCYPRSIEKDGKRFSPIRRIWPTVDLFNQELERNGFQVIHQEQEAPSDPTSVWMFRTRAIRNG